MHFFVTHYSILNRFITLKILNYLIDTSRVNLVIEILRYFLNQKLLLSKKNDKLLKLSKFISLISNLTSKLQLANPLIFKIRLIFKKCADFSEKS